MTLARLGLKFNPFDRSIPIDACRLTPQVGHFCRRVTHSARGGGFCLIQGPPGAGKSVALRHLHAQMSQVPEVVSAILIRPQASIGDLYRELGDLFGVELRPHNRWGGTKGLRLRWREHFDSSLHRPLLLVDEAQEMQNAVLNELRLLTAGELDSRALLTVVLAGDDRLDSKLRNPQLLPLASRIRVRLTLSEEAPEELALTLRHVIEAAGNTALMTGELIETLAEHSLGNLRALMHHAHDLLELAIEQDVSQITEDHYLALTTARQSPAPTATSRQRKTRKR